MKNRWIKAYFEEYSAVYEKLTDDIVSFAVDSVCGVYYVMMKDSKGNTTYLSEQIDSEELASLVLDKLMMFVTDEDFNVIDMDVIMELAENDYLKRQEEADAWMNGKPVGKEEI